MAGRRRRCPTRACSEPCSAAALFPTAIAVMGVALGALMRHTATAIGILVAMLVRRAGAVPDARRGVGRRASEYLPGEAGQAMITVVKDPGEMSPRPALLVLIGWIGALLAGATIALKRRDA